MGCSFGILGPLQVVVDGVDITPSAPKERALLAMLLINHGQAVGVEQLVEELWPKLDADRARRVLQVRAAALRKSLRDAQVAAVIDFVGAAYRLSVAPEDVDAERFSTLTERARGQSRGGDPAAAALSLSQALGLWRGPPLADVRGGLSLDAEAARLDEAHMDAIEDRIDAELVCGRHRQLLPELDGLVARYPLRERLWGQQVLALYRDGRQTEALQACASIRQRLADDWGVELGPALRALETAVLEQSCDLDCAPVADPRRRRMVDRLSADDMPTVHYAKAKDGVNLAYQVTGDGPTDLIIIPGYVSHLETWWEAWSGRLVRRLASFSRLILFDKRGTGLSDRPERLELEEWVADVGVVLDAVGSERAAVFGVSAGTPIAILFAATYPERTRALMLYGGYARVLWDNDYEFGIAPEELNEGIESLEAGWGSSSALEFWCPSARDDLVAREQFGRYQRISASPGSATEYLRVVTGLDVRHALPMVSAPTLVLHAARDGRTPIAFARYMAERIPDASLVELDSSDHLIWFSDALDAMTNEIQDFLTAAHPTQEANRVLATVLVVELGHGPQPLDSAVGCQLIESFRGRILRHGPTQVVAAFDGPARAIRCALAIVEDLRSKGLDARAGLHSGECDLTNAETGGVAVEIAQGVAALAGSEEVLVSQTVRDLVYGSTISFGDARDDQLDRLPCDWRVFAVTGV